VLTFGQGHQPIIEWAKGLCKLGTQGKEPDQHKAQKLFAWCFLFDPESKIEKVPCILLPPPNLSLESDPTLLHFSAKLLPLFCVWCICLLLVSKVFAKMMMMFSGTDFLAKKKKKQNE
jgi:hypothetical protein